MTVLVLCLGIATVVSADPIRLTSTNIFVVADNNGDGGWSGGFTFAGDGFAAGAGGIGVPTVTTFGFGPLDVSGTFGTSPPTSAENGYVIVGDQTLRGLVTAVFQFTANPIVIGNAPLGLDTFETSFTATGLVQVFDVGATQPKFTQAVYGTGALAVNAYNVGNGRFVTESMGLGFAPPFPPPAPTPEPAPVLLLGTGLLAAWQSRRLRAAC